jgi:hypothetical protein
VRAWILLATMGCTFRLADVVETRDSGTDVADTAVVIEASCSPDLNTDPLHCGRCNHSCLGGACSAGSCAAVNLAVAVAKPGGIALDDKHVFFTSTEDGTILRANKDGTAPFLLAQYQKDALSVALSGSALVYSSPLNKVVGIVDTTVGKPVTIANNQTVNWGYLAIDEGFVYWTDPPAGNVMRSPRVSPMASKIATGENAPHSLAIDKDFIYWTTGGGALVRAGKDGSGRKELASGLGAPTHLAIGGDQAYITDGTAKTVTRVALATGDKTTIATDQGDAHGVIVDGTDVYWAAAALMRFDGKTVSTFNTTGGIHRIAADATAVYWTEFAGSVKRKAK